MTTSMSRKLGHKAVMLGDAGVGKTALVQRYTDDDFKADLAPTVGGASKFITFEHNNRTDSIYLWDTAGQERYRGTTSFYLRNARAVMIVFDVTDERSFENIDVWIETFRSKENAQFIVVGNKVDLEEQRVISEEKAREKASQLGTSYFETSAKSGAGVEEAFTELFTLAVTGAVQHQAITVGEEKENGGSGCQC